MGDQNPGHAHSFCNCSAHCGASGKHVSVRTYYRHTQAQNRDLFGPALHAELASLAQERQSTGGADARGLKGIQHTRGTTGASRQQRTQKSGRNVIRHHDIKSSQPMESRVHISDVPETIPPNDNNSDCDLPDVGCSYNNCHSAQQSPSPQAGRQDEVREDLQVFECHIKELQTTNQLI
ncbi:hypothetical protein BJV74DRAFT_799187 [Russula compacta]|nr:hypothetical protein BJV74DRAFT_799187 [Russula compacta]